MELPDPQITARNTLSGRQIQSLQVLFPIMVVGAWALLPVYIISAIVSGESSYYLAFANSTALAVILTAAWFLNRRGYYLASIWLMIATILITLIIFNFIVAGLGIIVSITALLILLNLAWQTMPTAQAANASVAIALGCLGMYLVDNILEPAGRVEASLLLQQFIVVIGGIVILLLTINLLQHLEFRTIGGQIRTAFIIVSLIPVLVVSVPLVLDLIGLLNAQTNDSIIRTSNDTADEFDQFLSEASAELQEDTLLPAVISLLKDPINNPSNIARILSLRFPYNISYAILDINGNNLLDTNTERIGKSEAEADYFTQAVKLKNTYVSDFSYNKDLRRPVFFVSAPVLDELSNLIGVIRLEYDGQLIQDLATEKAKLAGEQVTILLVDKNNLILAHSSSPNLILKSLGPLDPVVARELQLSGKLASGSVDALNAGLEDLQIALQESQADETFRALVSTDDQEQDVVSAVEMETKSWLVLTSQHPSAFLAPVLNQLQTVLWVFIVVTIAILFGANLTANLLSNPIRALTASAANLARGLDTPMRLDRKDEIGELSIILENTSNELQNVLRNLEERVKERTLELDAANSKSSNRARQLQTIAQVSKATAGVRNVEDLLPEVAQRISEAFGYYHVGIFLLDTNREYAVLRASNSEGGRKMLERGHRLKVGHEGIVGFVTNSGRPRIALDVGEDAVYFRNPDLPETHSEIALPLQIGETIIGAIDVQSDQPAAFSQEDLQTLGLLSDQISIAIENSRLFEETRRALSQVESTYAQTTESAWREIARESATSGYRYIKGNIEPLHNTNMSIPATTINNEFNLEIPIMLRGEKLGSLTIRQPSRNRPWSDAESRLYQSIVDRLSFALENARLFSEARKRANFERITSEVSNKISNSVRFETILRTTAEELSRILGGAEVLVQIQPESVDKPLAKTGSLG